jgi:hypothetical protein
VRSADYGLGYTIGMLQMQSMLAERKRQLGDDFILKVFHDAFMAKWSEENQATSDKIVPTYKGIREITGEYLMREITIK